MEPEVDPYAFESSSDEEEEVEETEREELKHSTISDVSNKKANDAPRLLPKTSGAKRNGLLSGTKLSEKLPPNAPSPDIEENGTTKPQPDPNQSGVAKKTPKRKTPSLGLASDPIPSSSKSAPPEPGIEARPADSSTAKEREEQTDLIAESDAVGPAVDDIENVENPQRTQVGMKAPRKTRRGKKQVAGKTIPLMPIHDETKGQEEGDKKRKKTSETTVEEAGQLATLPSVPVSFKRTRRKTPSTSIKESKESKAVQKKKPPPKTTTSRRKKTPPKKAKNSTVGKTKKGNIQTPKRRHRFMPGTVSLREIRKYQRSTELLVPRLNMQRIIRDALMNTESNTVTMIQSKAIEALREACEDYLVEIFEQTNNLTIHRKRITITPADMRLAVYLMNRGKWPS